jgi:hypothetical protein
MPTRSEFAASIKAKYPAYKDVDDSTLVDKMLEKYPQYRDRVTDTPAAGMGDVKMAESQAGPIPEAPKPSLGQRTGFGPVADFAAQAGKAGLQFAGNVATALSTGPINAVAQGIQDDAGVIGTAGNVARAVFDPLIPGKSPIQSTETSLERAGVPNEPSQVRVPYPSASGAGMGILPPGFGPAAAPEDWRDRSGRRNSLVRPCGRQGGRRGRTGGS